MLERTAVTLREIGDFRGAGVYAIYYSGAFPPYRRIAERNRDGAFEAPIYVGKAVSQGARKGVLNIDAPPGKVLAKRLREHRESIEQATNLDVKDFHCRYLVVEDIWVPLGESLLIQRTSPLWNLVVDGFGNHDPGKGRHAGQQPLWDVVHPGRPWASRLARNTKSERDILTEIETFLRA
ncbi:MAG: Eco29kI family restriction endonuclease [Candidatus Methylomirabilis sp.]|nr:Eco29kI family restriction endonuclease [Deltaproteobacteria bacterium]